MPSRQSRGRDAREAQRRSRAYAARQAVHAEQGRRRRRDALLGVSVGILAIAVAVTGQVLWFTAGPGAPKPSATARPSATPSPSATPTATPSTSASPLPSATATPSARPSPSASG